ncbi:MAG: hypothetical protein RLZZ252_760 [Bacteroidota bacterium]|jgi:hypothetical protein
MVKRILTLIYVIYSFSLRAQTGIGTTTPNVSAKLDVFATNKGFLPPRISLAGTLDVSTISTPATGLVIYNTATAGTTPNNVIPGYYYYDGTKWNQLVDQSSLNAFSGYVPNYAQSNASSVSKSAVGDIVVSQTITSAGRPIQIIASGDMNPANAGGWVTLQLYRDGTAIGKKVQAESSAANENVPYCINFIDSPSAGTYTYSVKITNLAAGSYQFGEADGNQLTLLELGAWSAGTMPVSKGGTGNSSYTSGSIMFSDGTNITQDNANLFWDDTNNRLGIGTNAPNASSVLDVNSTSKGILIPRMTASQKSAIASPTTGLLIYQTDASTGFYYYNGSSWISISEPNWTSAGTIQSVGWGATTTAPSIGTTAVNDYSYKQLGAKTWKCQLTYSAGSSPTGMSLGSGDYLFTLPNGLQFNTSIPGQATYTGDVGASSWIWPSLWLSSSSGSITNLSQGGLLYVVPYSSTQFRLIHVGIAGVGFVIPYASGYYGVGANISWRLTFTFQSL